MSMPMSHRCCYCCCCCVAAVVAASTRTAGRRTLSLRAALFSPPWFQTFDCPKKKNPNPIETTAQQTRLAWLQLTRTLFFCWAFLSTQGSRHCWGGFWCNLPSAFTCYRQAVCYLLYLCIAIVVLQLRIIFDSYCFVFHLYTHGAYRPDSHTAGL